MLDLAENRSYWEEQARKGGNPCHYHNRWQDAYARQVRTRAFRPQDFAGAKLVVDIGCGIGEYTSEIAKKTTARVIGFDFPFNVAIARERFGGNPRLAFEDGALPNEAVRAALKDADVAYTTTVFVHLPPLARAAFFEYVRGMKAGAKVMLLEYIPDEIPAFQKNLPTKEVETQSSITAKFATAGFALKELRHVNFIDSFLFFHLGKNAVTYWLTLALERFLRVAGYTKSKYKMLIFVKS